ncbi:MAG: DNA-processing protein DprA [bacterium]|nr:DNA-processing protein DprA [bacterium]
MAEINTETETTIQSPVIPTEAGISNDQKTDSCFGRNDDVANELSILQALAAFRPNINASKLHALIKYAGSIEQAWAVPDEALEQYGWTAEQRQLFNAHRKNYQPEKALERLYHLGIEFIPDTSPKFPKSLLDIFDPPLGLYVRGKLHQNSLNIAFVGSRKATPYGKTVTNMLVRPLAAKGVVIISGLAYGIDAEAHQATLQSNGTTWAVMGNGCDEMTLYPRAHRQLAKDIINNDGAVISEYPPGTPGQPYFFPQRNRIVSGLSRAIVVVEAGLQSGALITARLGLEQNREVFAVPGPITSEMSQGTNELIRDGATPVSSAEQIMDALELFSLFGGISPSKAARQISHKDIDAVSNIVARTTSNQPQNDQEKVLTVLSTNPLAIDEIVKASTLPSQVVGSILTLLEIEGLVKDIGNKNYTRI